MRIHNSMLILSLGILLCFMGLLSMCTAVQANESQVVEPHNHSEDSPLVPETQHALQLSPEEIAASNLEFDVVQVRHIKQTVQLPGVVSILPQYKATIITPYQGSIMAVKYPAGGWVEKGEIIAYLYSPDIDQLARQAHSEYSEVQAKQAAIDHAKEHLSKLRIVKQHIQTRMEQFLDTIDEMNTRLDRFSAGFQNNQKTLFQAMEQELEQYLNQREQAANQLMIPRQKVIQEERDSRLQALNNQLSGLQERYSAEMNQTNAQKALVESKIGLETLLTELDLQILSVEEELALNELTYKSTHSQWEISMNKLRGYNLHFIKGLYRVSIAAPITGQILPHSIMEGLQVAAGQKLFMIINSNHSILKANVYQEDRPHVNLDTRVFIRPNGNEEPVETTVTYVSPISSEEDRTFEIHIQYPEPLPFPGEGSRIMVDLVLNEKECLSIPLAALDERKTMNYVYRFDGINAFYQEEVVTGIQDHEWVEIKEGINERKRVVSEGWHLIKAKLEQGTGLPPGAHICAGGTIHYTDDH